MAVVNYIDPQLLKRNVMLENTRKKKTDEDARTGVDQYSKEAGKNDYWNWVADDAASGYMSEDDDDSILNEDQEPGDNEPAGQESEGKE